MTMRDIQLSICRTLTSIGEPMTVQDLAGEIAVYDSRTQAAMLEAIRILAQHQCIVYDGQTVRATEATKAYMRKPARLSLGLADAIARGLVADLQDLPSVQRLEIGGSIRRRKPIVHDIELVAQVAPAQSTLFGGIDPKAPSMTLTNALRARADTVIRSGPSMTSVILSEPESGRVQVDLFLTADPAAWGMLFFIRTGSLDFVKRALGYWKRATNGGECSDLRLRLADGTPLDTPDEQAVFSQISDHAVKAGMQPVQYIPPQKRTARK